MACRSLYLAVMEAVFRTRFVINLLQFLEESIMKSFTAVVYEAAEECETNVPNS